MIRLSQLLLVLLFTLASTQAFAQSQWICDTIFKSSNYGCDNPSSSNSTGGSYPLLTDAFNVNPSSLPTTKTPLGVEMFWDQSKTNVAMIKGTGKAGAGFSSTTTEGPFFSNASNVEIAQLKSQSLRRSTDAEGTGAYAPNLNFGSSVNLLTSPGLTSNIGGQLKYINEAREFRPGAGWNFKTKILNGGVSYYKSPTTGSTQSASLGARIMNMVLDLTYLENKSGDPNRTLISSGTLVWKKFIFTGAYRVQSNAYLSPEYIDQLRASGVDYKKEHYMVGISFRPFDKLSIGYYENYILGKGSSFVLQYFF